MISKTLKIAAAAAAVSTASASVTISVGFGDLQDVGGTPVIDGGLVALIVDGNSGTAADGVIAGGLTANSSLTAGDSNTAHSAFAGQTIATGNFGSDYILAVSEVNSLNSGIAGYWSDALNGLDVTGLTTGAIVGLYWFPELTLASNTVGTSSFQIGGFNESILKDLPSNADMVLPADTQTVAWGASSDGLGGPVPAERFQAITATAVPEPSAALLGLAGLAIPVLRRRRS